MAEERRAIHAYLSAESHDVWQTIADEEGISLSGFLEALAADMGEQPARTRRASPLGRSDPPRPAGRRRSSTPRRRSRLITRGAAA